MEIRDSYNSWSSNYDISVNKTRDLEGIAIREMLDLQSAGGCLEAGCGTGKNTNWLAARSKELLSADISPGMLEKAQAKSSYDHVQFVVADLTREWEFGQKRFDLIVFSLVLEHIRDLDHVFREAIRCLRPGGVVYVGELHPFRQYQGSKARFETNQGVHVLECFTHHISEYFAAAATNGLQLAAVREYFDDGSPNPRILAMLFKAP